MGPWARSNSLPTPLPPPPLANVGLPTAVAWASPFRNQTLLMTLSEEMPEYGFHSLAFFASELYAYTSSLHEDNLVAGSSLCLCQSSAGSTRVLTLLRRGVAGCRTAGIAVHGDAGALAGW